MIIIKIHGGLGNQLFQYAFGRALAIKNNCSLKLDPSFYLGQDKRAYFLDRFSILENIATKNEIDKIKGKPFSKINQLRFKYFRPRPYIVEEKDLQFDPQYLSVGDHTYLSGYWQSANYFRDISALIRQEFELKNRPSAANQKLLDHIDSNNAISIHIRRGDFVKDNSINQIHGALGLDYYHRAVSLLEEKIADPFFYVFSDDIPWVRLNLGITGKIHFVENNNQEASFEDLRLMQRCKHHIIANSTFSWWGAWLNPNPDKIVIAPEIWFADPVMNLQSSSIIPEKWLRI